jgi:ribose/xylose/arabinose/galactoside ABC-type transport system permease subunit
VSVTAPAWQRCGSDRAHWEANPIVLTIAAGFAMGGGAVWFSGGRPASPSEGGYDGLGGNLTLNAIAAVLVGGTAIAAGRGSALQTLGGSLLIASISDAVLLRGFSTGAQILAKGPLVLVIVVVVHLGVTRGRR